MTLQHGDWLHNRYYIEDKLGQGGFGTVYLAYDEQTNQNVAIKENIHEGPEAPRQFEREATILAGLHHPNLPRVLDYFEDEGLYLVMDFIRGLSLSELLNNRGQPLTEAEALPWITQICSALSYLHQQALPIIHRDVKPANIIITPERRAMLVDFGIAKFYKIGEHTTTSAYGVSHGYAPPEQYGQARTDARTDVYAVGATLFRLLTNHHPPEALDRIAHHEQFPSFQQLNIPISPHVQQAIVKAVEISSHDRFQTMEQFKQALRNPQFIHTAAPLPPSSTDSYRPPSPATGNYRPWLSVLIPLIAVVILAVGFIITGTQLSTSSEIVSAPTTPPIIMDSTAPPATSPPLNPTFAPTATPIPLIVPGTYPVNRCITHPVTTGIELQLCINHVVVAANHTLTVHVSWMGHYQDITYQIKKGSDLNNPNMYLTDNSGQRYNHIDSGGAAAQEVLLNHNQAVQGWFQFPAPQPGATVFTFHDDDLGQRIEGIVLQ